MSSNGWSAEDRSRENQRVSITSMQAAKPTEDGLCSQLSPEVDYVTPAALMVLMAISTALLMYPSLVEQKELMMLLVLVLMLLMLYHVGRYWRDLALLLAALLLAAGRFPLWHPEVMMVAFLLIFQSCNWKVPVLVLVAALAHVFLLLWWQEVLLLIVVLVLLLTLERFVNSGRACMHGRSSRLVKQGPHDWVLDSGAWIHHTSNRELLFEGGDFQSHQEMDNKDAPSSGDGDDVATLHVEGRGSVRMGCFDFPGVHYVVGDDTRNVVSVSQLARDHGLVTVFEPTSCHVKEKKTGKIVGKGRLRNGVYILDSLRIVGQYIGDRGASGGSERDDGEGGARGHGEQGNNGEEGDSGMAEGRGGGGQNRDGRGGRAGHSSGSGAAGGDINDEEIVNQEEGSSGNEIQEMNDEKIDQDDIGKTHQEINGNGEDEDKKRGCGGGGGSTFSELFNNKASIGLSRLVIVLCWCIAACIIAACISVLLQCTSRRTGGTILPMDFYILLGFSLLIILSFSSLSMEGSLFRGRSTEGTTGDYYAQESPQEHNKRLFGLSRRFDNVHLPARAFPTSTTNAASRPEDFFVDSGAYYHTTWKESILFHYPWYLQNHTKPPTLSLGGIAAGSIAVTRSGYLNGNNIMLDGVLLALEAQANLVSVGQLSVYYGVQVEMDDVGVVIKKKQNGVQIGGGKIVGNLYVLEYFLPGGLFAHHCPTPHP